MNLKSPTAYITDRETLHFDKQDAVDDSDGFVYPLYKDEESNFDRTAQWLYACGKKPSEENLSLQIGCQIEEFCEFLSTLRIGSEGYAKLLERTISDLEWFASKLKRGEQQVYIPIHLRAEALDALCDIEVTGNGVAYLAGFNKPAADKAVLKSNDAKLVNGKPVLLEGGKIGKPEGWKAPKLESYV
jgi:predicted HAD superfamily Cof-like phosphohydrolase